MHCGFISAFKSCFRRFDAAVPPDGFDPNGVPNLIAHRPEVAQPGCGGRMSQKRIFPTLDGWRGVAVIGVILYHGKSNFFADHSLLLRLRPRHFGVDIFFAISGFLICGLLLKEYEATATSVCGASTYEDSFAFCLRTMSRWPSICAVGVLGVIA